MPPTLRPRKTSAQGSTPSKRSKKETKKISPRKGKPVKSRARKSDKKQKTPSRVAKQKSRKDGFLEKVDPFFVKNIQELTGGRENLRIFVPLCGNSPDMLWLANQGHTVVGVEIEAKWIRSFFRKSELEFSLSSLKIGSEKKANVYKAIGKEINIYQCDIFDFSLEAVPGGKFDGIWDQSAVPVINMLGEKRVKDYANLLQSLLAPEGHHVVEVCKHGADHITTERLQDLYGENCDVRYLGTRVGSYELEEDCEVEGLDHGRGGHSHAGEHSHEGNSHEGNSHEDHSHEGHSHEGHSHEGHSHGEHGDEESTDVEMFYYVISFK